MEEICSEARTQMQSPMTYSEPALAGCEMACYSVHHCTMSDTALLCVSDFYCTCFNVFYCTVFAKNSSLSFMLIIVV